jgi:hypothetical protein
MPWLHTTSVNSIRYQCGYCGSIVAPHIGYKHEYINYELLICPACEKPTFRDLSGMFSRVTPGVPFGSHVDFLPENIEIVYNEARRCMMIDAYTSAVLCCRKLLMNIAVSKGASEGKNFKQYVEYLDGKGYIPPDGKHWVEHIRDKGNEATHEIKPKSVDDAETLLTFIEMLLRFVFEFPSRIPKKDPKDT